MYALTCAGVALAASTAVQPIRFCAVDAPSETPSPTTPAPRVAAVVNTCAVIVDPSPAWTWTAPKLRTTLDSMCAFVELRMTFVEFAPAPARLAPTPRLRLAAAAAAPDVDVIVALEVAETPRSPVVVVKPTSTPLTYASTTLLTEFWASATATAMETVSSGPIVAASAAAPVGRRSWSCRRPRCPRCRR